MTCGTHGATHVVGHSKSVATRLMCLMGISPMHVRSSLLHGVLSICGTRGGPQLKFVSNKVDAFDAWVCRLDVACQPYLVANL